MRIAICHYHLQTGGVTRVIRHACQALIATGHRVVVLAGEPPQGLLPEGVAFAHIPALTYEERREALAPATLAAAMREAAATALGGPPDLWHIHNHSLGKNLAVPGAVAALAHRGERLLLQPHDFAEDGRPALYARLLAGAADGDSGRLAALLYPLAGQVHYAVLNGRDRAFLAGAGVPDEQLHLLPNAVSIPPRPGEAAHPFPGRRLWLYPTRAIRRKNLGELLLWSTLAGPDDVFGATQAPQNPAEQPGYRRWAALAEELELPLELELGTRVDDFDALLACAHALLTTSVAEGFGLAFLESWLVGRPLAGRDLPEITRDFTASGVDLTGLYRRLDVPLRWLDAARLRRAAGQALAEVMAAYGRTATPRDAERLWGAMVQGDRVDFGRLDEPAQEEVIRHLATSPSDGAQLTPAGLEPRTDGARIEANRAVIERDYSIAGYGRRLADIYGALLGSAMSRKPGAADGNALLERFLAPERLCLLRT